MSSGPARVSWGGRTAAEFLAAKISIRWLLVRSSYLHQDRISALQRWPQIRLWSGFGSQPVAINETSTPGISGKTFAAKVMQTRSKPNLFRHFPPNHVSTIIREPNQGSSLISAQVATCNNLCRKQINNHQCIWSFKKDYASLHWSLSSSQGNVSMHWMSPSSPLPFIKSIIVFYIQEIENVQMCTPLLYQIPRTGENFDLLWLPNSRSTTRK